MSSTTKLQVGFTLIELLVVTAIIGLLSSITLSSLNTARAKARDTRRIADVRQIQTALALYYDTNHRYPRSPDVACASQPNPNWVNSVECVSAGRWVRDGSSSLSGFIPIDPVDPINKLNWPRGAYYYYADGGPSPISQWYMIVYALEIPNPRVEPPGGSVVYGSDGFAYRYGDGTNGIMTVGVSGK